MNSILTKLFGVSNLVIDFVVDHKSKFLQRLWIALPLVAWTSIFYQLNPLLIKFQVDSLTQNWNSIAGITLSSVFQVFLVIVIIYAFLNLLDGLFNYLQEYYVAKLNQEAESFLEDKFTKFLTHFDGAFLSSENNLRLIRNLQWSLKDIENKFLTLIQKSVQSLFGFGALFFVIPFIHPWLLGVIAISVVVDLTLDYLQNQSWRQFELVESRQSEQRSELKWRIIWYFNQILANNWMERIFKIYTDRREKYFQTRFEQENIDRLFKFLKASSQAIVYSLATLIAGYLVIKNEIPIGTFVVFGLYITRLKTQFESFAEVFRNLFELRFDLFRLDFLLHIQPKLDYTNIQSFKQKEIQKIEIKNLNFRYPEFFKEEIEYLGKMQQRIGMVTQIDEKKKISPTEKQNWFGRLLFWIRQRMSHQSLSVWSRKRLTKELKELEEIFTKSAKNELVLKDFSVTFEKGKIYSLVGYNGAGKTTLTKLLKRTIDPTKGEILINDKSLTTIEPLYWKKYLASLEQENFLWESLSIRDNLLLGLENKKVSDKEIFSALEKVGLKDKVKDLDAIIGEGVELSGGQNQLLEIARVLIQKKPVVILDEGTNQLDAEKEAKIMKLLQEIKQNSIVIFITHRMTTCRNADQILVLENGKLTAQGSPKELLNSKKSNLFQKFWKLQVVGE